MSAQKNDKSGYRTPIILATLGPFGTCSEQAAHAFQEREGIPLEVQLLASFEVCMSKLRCHLADLALIPAAYPRFNELVFRNIRHLAIAYSIITQTPPFLLAKRPGFAIQGKIKLATHQSPSPLVSEVISRYPDANIEIDFVDSNANAAQLVADGIYGVCITNQTSAEPRGLEIVHDFGSVPMLWAVFRSID